MDITETQLDFTGKPKKTKTTHTKNGNTIATIDNFTYDHVGRLLTQTQCIGGENMGYACDSGMAAPKDLLLNRPITSTTNAQAAGSITLLDNFHIIGAPGLSFSAVINPNASGGSGGAEELIAYNSYDDLGQLQAKKVGGTPADTYENTASLQTVDYTYNIRGWLKTINQDLENDNDLFNFGISYNTVTHGGTPLYNGNIAETRWQTANTDNTQKWYTYQYDPLNRITAATGGANTNFDVTGITYDKNGNIGNLNRRGNDGRTPASANYGLIDQLYSLRFKIRENQGGYFCYCLGKNCQHSRSYGDNF